MVNIIDSFTSLNAPDLGALKQTLPLLFWAVVVTFILWILFKLATHRIFVEELIKVQGGYVARGSRFKKAFDRDNKQQYLKPMFGGGPVAFIPF